MAIVVNWVAVISAELFQAPFISDFESAWKHCCLPASRPLSFWNTGTCCTAEFAPLLCDAGL